MRSASGHHGHQILLQVNGRTSGFLAGDDGQRFVFIAGETYRWRGRGRPENGRDLKVRKKHRRGDPAMPACGAPLVREGETVVKGQGWWWFRP